MNLVRVDLADVLPDLRQSLQRIKRETGERWPVDFVFYRIQEGRAGLFRFEDGGKHVAFLVCEMHSGHENVLNIWCVEGSPGIARRDEMVRLIDDLARETGAGWWKLESPRKGWARMLRGFVTNTRTVYERKLP